MNTRCPLCLKSLDAGDALVRLCYYHPKDWTRVMAATASYGKLACGKWTCRRRGGRIREGVFILHEGCDARNPYWDERTGQVSVPPTVTVNGENLDAWELAMLRLAARDHAKRPEMWFPHVLYELANQEGGGLGRLVRIAGSQKVGKSVLAMMAFAPSSYQRDSTSPYRNIEHFVYVPPPAEAGVAKPFAEFEEALYPINLMRHYRAGAQWVLPSRPDKLNVKAVFLGAPAAGSGTHAGGDSSRPRQFLRRLDEIMGILVWIARDLVTSADADVTREEPAEWDLITFYDTAGEHNKPEVDAMIARLDQVVGVVAVLIDATDISSLKASTETPGKPNSIPIALAQLAQLGGGPRRCLIVTKLDLVRHAVGVGAMPSAGERLQLLESWLKSGTRQEQDLRRLLLTPGFVDRIFFVWTEGLDDPNELPCSFGLKDFLDWCLSPA